METKVLINSIKNFKTMYENQTGYKVAYDIDLDEIKASETEQLKKWCFEMACTIVHANNELRKIEKFIEFNEQNEEVK